jgi:hypothetical protein
VPGVEGINTANGPGVQGSSDAGRGVAGISQSWQGVYGRSETQAGVVGESAGFDGVYGTSAAKDASGVAGHNTGDGTGVFGGSEAGRGVAGFSKSWQGVYGYSESQAGVVGESTTFDGIWGASHSADHAAVSGHNDAGGYAGYFEGKVTVTRDLIVGGDVVIPNADAAEDFGVAGDVVPGTVMVIDGVDRMTSCSEAYDTRVAGVISGAGSYRPGIVLDRAGARGSGRQPVALMGKVYCKADATFGPIRPGDLLTTSPTVGHAMRATDKLQQPGAVLGKALHGLDSGRGLIPILVSLQ